jgi:hypothetical protein
MTEDPNNFTQISKSDLASLKTQLADAHRHSYEVSAELAEARARNVELEAVNLHNHEVIADYEESHLRVMNERCANDERHCTCVPALRARIAELEGNNAAILSALISMVRQYLTTKDEHEALPKYFHYFMSAGEEATELLERLGIMKEIGGENYVFAEDEVNDDR